LKADITYNHKEASSSKMLFAMVSIGAVCALLIVFTFETTFNTIKHNKAEALEKAIFKVVPNTEYSQPFVLDNSGLVAVQGEINSEKVVYACYNKNDELLGVAIEGAGQGYADVIRIIYGYDFIKETVIGFYVLETKETPGLGDKIEKDENFLANFIALDVSLNDDKKAKKQEVITVKSGAKQNNWEIDGITGATISSRAIGDILEVSTSYWLPIVQQNLSSLKSAKK